MHATDWKLGLYLKPNLITYLLILQKFLIFPKTFEWKNSFKSSTISRSPQEASLNLLVGI